MPRKHRTSMGRKSTTARRPSTVVMDETEPTAMGKPGVDEPQDSLFNQVYGWLQREKAKQRTHVKSQTLNNGVESAVASDADDDDDDCNETQRSSVSSTPNKKTLALERLEKILLEYATTRYEGSNTSVSSARRSARRRPTKKGLRRASTSDSDTMEVEYGAPAVDAILDNSKTLAYSGGGVGDDEDGISDSKRKEAWATFKTEIVRLTHTLEIKGWGKVPMESAVDIDVVRLSGALTNAVYVVTPPATLPPPPRAEDGSYTLVPRRPPS